MAETSVTTGLTDAMTGPRGGATKLRGPHLIEAAGHWLQQEAPEQVADLVLAFREDIA